VAVIGVNAFATAKPLIDKCVDVNEAHIALAILRLIEYEKIIVEGAAAVGLAALTAGRLPELKGKRVVLVLSGCNIDTVVLARCIDRGLALDGRLVCFEVWTAATRMPIILSRWSCPIGPAVW
jgi:threonine dehydratase